MVVWYRASLNLNGIRDGIQRDPKFDKKHKFAFRLIRPRIQVAGSGRDPTGSDAKYICFFIVLCSPFHIPPSLMTGSEKDPQGFKGGKEKVEDAEKGRQNIHVSRCCDDF